MNIAQHGLILLARVYQVVLSPVLAAACGPSGRCRYHPSCSCYAMEAVRLHGAVIGSYLTVKRLVRCHPWAAWGEDPPPPAGSLKLPAFRRGNCHHGS